MIDLPKTSFNLRDVVRLKDSAATFIIIDIYYSIAASAWLVKYEDYEASYVDRLSEFEELFTKERDASDAI